MQHCKIVGIGHPRSGTKTTATLLQKYGLDVGHETIKKDGVVAWQLLAPYGPYPYITDFNSRPKFDYLIYNVRNPFDSIPSIVYTEDTKIPSFNFRLRECKIPLKENNPIENAIISISYFDKLIDEMQPHITFRVEDQSDKLFKFLKRQKIKINYTKIPKKKYNRRKHPNFEEMVLEFGDISYKCKKLFNNFCFKHGYLNKL